jgi:hypothetical protein
MEEQQDKDLYTRKDEIYHVKAITRKAEIKINLEET